jgi:nucleoside-diphosphate-sugar epimerase
MTIFVTGEKGKVGSSLRGEDVVRLKFSSDGISREDLGLIKPNDCLVHLAAVVGEKVCLDDPDLAKKINVEASENLAEQILCIPDVSLIYMSTGHVYGKASSPRSEQDHVNPMTLYAELKYRGEEKIRKVFQGSEERYSILRLFSILDVNLQDYSLPARVVRILEGNDPSKVIPNSSDVRDFLTLGQIGSLIEQAITNKISGTYNLCSGRPVTVREACVDFGKRIGYSDIEEKIDFLHGYSKLPYLVGKRDKWDKISLLKRF